MVLTREEAYKEVGERPKGEKVGYRDNKWNWKAEVADNEYISPIQVELMQDLHNPNYEPFRLDTAFVNKYASVKPKFGFNGVGEVTYLRTYSRIMPDGKKETWKDTVERVVNGTFNMQKRWAKKQGIDWDDYKAKEHAEEMYDRIFNFKFTPPGRGLWLMGSEATEQRGNYAGLNNCGFASTQDIEHVLAKPFTFLMDMSMVGVGVGFDNDGAGKIVVKGPDYRRPTEEFKVPDTREGWVESVRRQIESHFLGIQPIAFDYSDLRPRGELIVGFGGKASGGEPLRELHQDLEYVLKGEKGRPITSTTITDMQNLIGKCVVAGNVRRTAEIAFGRPDDEEFLDLKNPKLHQKQLQNHRWASNNSVLAEIGMDYNDLSERIRLNGEPGLFWRHNAQAYSRMGHPADWKDKRVAGANPCVEQSLESFELCNLVETFPNNHEDLDDFKRTLKFAYLFAKTVSLVPTHWPETNRVLLRNRRIGTSMSGVQQFVGKRGLNELIKWANEGYDTIQAYDEKYSGDWFAVPKSVKTTSIKPSGTVSLLAGATPGMHWPVEGQYYVRRINFANEDELLGPIREAGYHVEPSVSDKHSVIVEFPVYAGEGLRGENEVSMWEQLEMAALLQQHWADNQVSCTIKFNPVTEGHQIARALEHFEHRLKGISFLPNEGHGYAQAPYEAITREQYLDKSRHLKPLDFSNAILTKDAIGERFCDNSSCEIVPKTGLESKVVNKPAESKTKSGKSKRK